MKTKLDILRVSLLCCLQSPRCRRKSPSPSATGAIPVTVDNFIRAESDLYFSVVALKEGGLGKFEHHRDLSPVDAQTVIRMNRDTLYSAAVFDLDAGPVTITLPDAKGVSCRCKPSVRMNTRLRAIYERGPSYSDPGESRHALRPRGRAHFG